MNLNVYFSVLDIFRPNPGCRGKAAVPLYTTLWWGTASSSSWSTLWTPSVTKVMLVKPRYDVRISWKKEQSNGKQQFCIRWMNGFQPHSPFYCDLPTSSSRRESVPHFKDWLFLSGHFKEKASILHKMAKQKCKEEAANANGVGKSQCEAAGISTFDKLVSFDKVAKLQKGIYQKRIKE